MGRLKDKVAIITGAASGQGAAEARLFAAEGAKVVMTDVDDAGREIAEEIGANALFLRHDVAEEDQWASVVGHALDRFGKIDILVNNAAVYRPFPFQQTDKALMDIHYRVNQLGVYFGMAAVLEPMTRNGGGSIVNISSGAGLKGTPGMFAYAGSKWAVRGMSRSAAVDLAPVGIRVNSVHPGLIDTPLIRNNPPEFLEFLTSLVPVKRLGEAEEVARTVLFLASDEASYVTGAEISVCGAINA
jgi:3alpha(or 20beta)-hydroxysteroid dehydrogenase